MEKGVHDEIHRLTPRQPHELRPQSQDALLQHVAHEAAEHLGQDFRRHVPPHEIFLLGGAQEPHHRLHAGPAEMQAVFAQDLRILELRIPHEPIEGRAILVGFEGGARRRLEELDEGVLPRPAEGGNLLGLAPLLDYRAEQAALGAEVPEKERLVQPRQPRNPPRRGAVVAVSRHDLQPRREEPPPRLGAVAPAPATAAGSDIVEDRLCAHPVSICLRNRMRAVKRPGSRFHSETVAPTIPLAYPFGMRRSRLFLLALVSTVAACSGGNQGERSVSPYGEWRRSGDGTIEFVYNGPTASPQVTTQDAPSIPFHLFGNDAWSGFVDAGGHAWFFLRTGGPMWIGKPDAARGRQGSGWGFRLGEGGTVPIRRDATENPGAIRFAPRSYLSHGGAGVLDIRQSIEIPEGRAFRAVKTITFVAANPGASGAWADVWNLTPHALLPAVAYGGDFSIGTDRAREAWNERYDMGVERPDARTVLLRIVPREEEPATAPPEFGPFPRALTLRSLDADLVGATLLDSSEADPSHGKDIGAGPLAVSGPIVVALHVPLAPPPEGSPDGTVRLRFELEVTPAPGTEPPPAETPSLPRTAVKFAGPDVPPWLTDELAWHSGQLQASAAYDAAFGESFVDQGSAYLYLQGASGAVRDLVLHALGLIPVRPDLARSNLIVAMQWTRADGHIYYTSTGFGNLSDAAIRSESTDLDFFLLWGLTRYVLETRDFAFLDRTVPFAGGGESTVRDRFDLALRHAMDVTGTGPNGWVRVGTGDWSDGVLLFSPNPSLTRQKGESFFNTALALAVLPVAKSLVATWNPPLADEVAAWLERLRTAAESGWAGRWYVRGSFGDGGLLGTDRPFLESNLFALSAGLGLPEQRRMLADAIRAILDEPEPLGARIVYPPSELAGSLLEPGWDVNGGVWPALNGLLSPALAATDPEHAWRVFLENTLHAHAEAYPNVWYGTWTGPDSYNAFYAERPGETFVHLATPMTDFPAANMNVHSSVLSALDALVGIEPTVEGIRLDPKLPIGEWTYRSAVMSVEWARSSIRLDYHLPVEAGAVWMVRVPDGWRSVCDIAGNSVPAANGWASLPLGAVTLTPCNPL